jgi:hypothetical protein
MPMPPSTTSMCTFYDWKIEKYICTTLELDKYVLVWRYHRLEISTLWRYSMGQENNFTRISVWHVCMYVCTVWGQTDDVVGIEKKVSESWGMIDWIGFLVAYTCYRDKCPNPNGVIVIILSHHPPITLPSFTLRLRSRWWIDLGACSELVIREGMLSTYL